MKTVIAFLALAFAIPTLSGCSSDSPTNNTTAPPPQDSGMGDGSGLKNKAKLDGEKAGGRQIPKAK